MFYGNSDSERDWTIQELGAAADDLKRLDDELRKLLSLPALLARIERNMHRTNALSDDGEGIPTSSSACSGS